MSNPTPITKVIAAMSGGVDSSVVAKLLADQGHDALGITLHLHDSNDVTCGTSKEAADARAVADALGIEHRTLDYAHCFTEQVIDRFCASYLKGETPNPCVECNRRVKFRTLLDIRESLGCSHVATGHYARIDFDAESGRYLLKKGLDESKDQSYVLYTLSQDDLAHTLFPLGCLPKQDVRAIAAHAGFINADKPESQDICFIPDGDYRAFIQRHTGRTLPPGNIVDVEGNVLGQHTGLDCYTIGQRKGICVAAAYPLYVCRKDMERNELVVGPAEQATCTSVMVEDVNWISVPCLEEPLNALVKTFYRQKPLPTRIVPIGSNAARLEFDSPVRACAPGQSAVFYDEDVVIGGGTIVSCA